MKVITAFFAAFAFVLIAACGSDGGGGFTSNDQQPNITTEPVNVSVDPGYHDAIDFSPAANPAEREQAYLQVAADLAGIFIPEPNQNLVFKLRWEEPIDGNASILIIGFFQEGERWVERQTDFRITRTAVGNWILKDEIDFVKTDDQLSLEYQERKKIEDEIQRQEDLAELNRIQEAFDSITIKFISTEYIPDGTGDPGIDGFVFHLALQNPTQHTHNVTYYTEWMETMSTSESNECYRDYWGGLSGRFDQDGSEKLAPMADIRIEDAPYTTVSYRTRFCDELVVEILDLSITKIDGYTPERLAQELSVLQTSP